MTPHDAAELISLGATFPTISLSLLVVIHFFEEAWSAIKAKGTLDATQWFIMGVAIGFAGGIVDNLYWGVAWSSSYLAMPSTEWIFDNGVYANIFARQGAGAIAAYCHVRAAISVLVKNESVSMDRIKGDVNLKLKWLKLYLISSFVGGVLFVGGLVFVRYLL